MLSFRDSNKRNTATRMCLTFLAGAALFFLLIMSLRGIMNAVNRMNFISQRLDDYPHLRDIYMKETEQWWNWWLTEDYKKRAQQAAFIYREDTSCANERDKLAHITKTLNAESARIVSRADYSSILEQDSAKGMSTCYAELEDGRYLVLSFSKSAKDDRISFIENRDYFLSQLQAGLPGYICIVSGDELEIYPKDEQAKAIRATIEAMLKNGHLDHEALRQNMKKKGGHTALKAVLNDHIGTIPAREYLLYCAAYSDNDDFVINATKTSILFRFGRKRSWSLWHLCCAIMLLLAKCIWNIRIYEPNTPPEEERHQAVKKGLSAMLFASTILLGCIIIIQLLSGVNLSQQGATDQAEYLKNALQYESERAELIVEEFDAMYSARAHTAASVLSENPKLIDLDTLHSLDKSLYGSGLRVFNENGKLLATDESLYHATSESTDSIATTIASNNEASPVNEQPQAATTDPDTRYYRELMINDAGNATGWVELCVPQENLDQLLHDTRLNEVIGDLHILDTLHAVVVEKNGDNRIVACTWGNWVGDLAEEHSIHISRLYDGYEGIIDFEGKKCYSVIFNYDDNFVIVGSEKETALVFMSGVLVLAASLLSVMVFVVYRPLTRHICIYQKHEYEADFEHAGYASRNEYPMLAAFLSDFMIAVFLLSSALFFLTKGDPAGLTYNIVRGKWIHGINVATVTTCIMLASLVFAIQRPIDLFLIKLGKYMSPKGRSVCRLLNSFLSYAGAIVMIIYTLSMFGVNTTTLVGGVGVTALIFTLGANSLIADVLAGIFIIFEGNFTVGDFVKIESFCGIVTDISMRTTKILDDDTMEVLVINNSAIHELINLSSEKSGIFLDFTISRAIGLEKGEEIVKEALQKLPEMYPKLIGTPQYMGVSEPPKEVMYTGRLGSFQVRILIYCNEVDREPLMFQVNRTIVEMLQSYEQSIPPDHPITQMMK